MTFRVTALDHVQITAPEELIDEVLEYYRDCLRLEPLEKPEGARPEGGWFRIGEGQLHVSVDPHNPSKAAHFGIVVDDFVEVVDRLRECGVHIEQAEQIPGRRRCYTRDPAGNRIEIMSYVADSG
jgi:catechol 2,3-dioxygenase-like lactoylglutathione lyase family enzyme